jgi:hypothetical protein
MGVLRGDAEMAFTTTLSPANLIASMKKVSDNSDDVRA